MNNAFGRAVVAGAAGAGVLTAVHQLGARLFDDAPRMDVVAMRGIRRLFGASTGARVADRPAHRLALAGDLLSNSAYYALVAARPTGAWWRGAALGAGAGAGALLLPRPLGLGDPPHVESMRNRVLTVAWYLAGGLAAAAAARALSPKTHSGERAVGSLGAEEPSAKAGGPATAAATAETDVLQRRPPAE